MLARLAAHVAWSYFAAPGCRCRRCSARWCSREHRGRPRHRRHPARRQAGDHGPHAGAFVPRRARHLRRRRRHRDRAPARPGVEAGPVHVEVVGALPSPAIERSASPAAAVDRKIVVATRLERSAREHCPDGRRSISPSSTATRADRQAGAADGDTGTFARYLATVAARWRCTRALRAGSHRTTPAPRCRTHRCRSTACCTARGPHAQKAITSVGIILIFLFIQQYGSAGSSSASSRRRRRRVVEVLLSVVSPARSSSARRSASVSWRSVHGATVAVAALVASSAIGGNVLQPADRSDPRRWSAGSCSAYALYCLLMRWRARWSPPGGGAERRVPVHPPAARRLHDVDQHGVQRHDAADRHTCSRSSRSRAGRHAGAHGGRERARSRRSSSRCCCSSHRRRGGAGRRRGATSAACCRRVACRWTDVLRRAPA